MKNPLIDNEAMAALEADNDILFDQMIDTMFETANDLCATHKIEPAALMINTAQEMLRDMAVDATAETITYLRALIDVMEADATEGDFSGARDRLVRANMALQLAVLSVRDAEEAAEGGTGRGSLN